jgi:murein DD-endopeptidase MepM/ murein hydrolase activator NlpD
LSPEAGQALAISYTVQVGDNLWSIAREFDLEPETVLWANPAVERSPDLLEVGDVLLLPAVEGVLHTVRPGDTLVQLAETYHTTVDEIVAFEPNGLGEDGTLGVGRQILLVGGRKTVQVGEYYPLTHAGEPPADAPRGSGHFVWPVEGILAQKYWSGHLAIDVASHTGTPIVAADAGYVILAGRDVWGYGNQVLIDHGNGYLTHYAHMNTILVGVGDSVEKGQQIGTVGSSGRSTGPHLHFEILEDGNPRDPLQLLPGG